MGDSAVKHLLKMRTFSGSILNTTPFELLSMFGLCDLLSFERLLLFFCFIEVLGGQVSHCPDWPRTGYLLEASLELPDPPVSTSKVLELQGCHHAWFYHFFVAKIYLYKDIIYYISLGLQNC